MSQTSSFVIANDAGAAVRARINEVIAALQSTSAGASAPTATTAGMRRQAATDIDPRLFHEILIRPDRRELQRLVELRRDAGGFKVVEYKIHRPL